VSAQLEEILAKLRAYLQQHYGDRLYRLILFGSHARNEATADSDIDVLIVLEDPVEAGKEIDATGEFVANLCLDYEVLISCLFFSKARFLTEQGPLLRNIRREGVLL
jgi:predicted nucleotidyltransferase